VTSKARQRTGITAGTLRVLFGSVPISVRLLTSDLWVIAGGRVNTQEVTD